MRLTFEPEHGYVIELEGPATRASTSPLLQSDLLPLLPRGSDWSGSRGERCFFGTPLSIRGRRWLGVGIIEPLRVETPGAASATIATMEAYLHPLAAAPVEGLRALARRLSPEVSLEPVSEHGVIRPTADEPGAIAHMEAQVLVAAAARYLLARPLRFRSRLLSADEAPRLRERPYLLGVTNRRLGALPFGLRARLLLESVAQ